MHGNVRTKHDQYRAHASEIPLATTNLLWPLIELATAAHTHVSVYASMLGAYLLKKCSLDNERFKRMEAEKIYQSF